MVSNIKGGMRAKGRPLLENRILSRIFGPKMKENSEWKKAPNAPQ